MAPGRRSDPRSGGVVQHRPPRWGPGRGQHSREAAEKYRRETLKGSGAGLYFAHEMLRRSGVPQGLIATARGGSTMEQWNPKVKEGVFGLYGYMRQSVELTGQPVSGILWYQGESDAVVDRIGGYTEAMTKLIAASRRDLRQPNLPWVIVQLARVFDGRSDDAPADGRSTTAAWNSIQEQQRCLPLKIKNVAVVPAVDLPMDDYIHVGEEGFPILGWRLAEMAGELRRGGKKLAPQFQKIAFASTPHGPCLDVTFSSVEKGLRAPGDPNGFSLVDSAGKSHSGIYKATLHGNRVRLHLTPPCLGSSLHYGHAPSPVATSPTDGACRCPFSAPSR